MWKEFILVANNVPETKKNQSTGWNVDWEKFLPACESILLIDSALRKTWFCNVIVTGKDGKKIGSTPALSFKENNLKKDTPQLIS